MLKPRKSVIAQTITRELQRAAVDAAASTALVTDLAVIVEQERRIDADAVVVEEADDQEQRRRQREQHDAGSPSAA